MLKISFPDSGETQALKNQRRPIDAVIPSTSSVPTTIRTLSHSTQGPGRKPATFGGWDVQIELAPSYTGNVRFGTKDAPLKSLHVDDANTRLHHISLTDVLGKELKVVEHILAIVWASRIAFDMRFYGTTTAPTLADCIQGYVDRIFWENLRNTPWVVQYVTVEKPVLFQRGQAYMLIEPMNERNPQLTLDTSVDYPTPRMAQRVIADASDELLEGIAGARTPAYGLRSLLLRLNENPLVRNTLWRRFRQFSTNNVMSHDKTGIHNPNPEFHFQSDSSGEIVNWELAYHELIDRFWSLALLHPYHLLGRVTSHRTWHAFDVAAMKWLKSNRFLKSIS